MTTVRDTPLPKGMRRAAWATLILAFLLGFSAAQSFGGALRPLDQDALNAAVEASASIGILEPEVTKNTVRASIEAQASAIDGMRNTRLLFTLAQALACSLLMLGSARLLWPGGAAREGVRRSIVGSAWVAAFARTLVGAQDAAIGMRGAYASAPELAKSKIFEKAAELPASAFASSWVFFAAAWTAMMVAALLLIARYFRLERVEQTIRDLDAASGNNERA